MTDVSRTPRVVDDMAWKMLLVGLHRGLALFLFAATPIGCISPAYRESASTRSARPANVEDKPMAESTSLRKAAGDRILIGTAIMAENLRVPQHARLIAEQFDCITPGNEMKPDALQPERFRFAFERGDAIVAFAEAHDMKVIGHTLVWHSQAPAWLFQDKDGRPLTRDAALANMKDHIRAVVSHYKGRVKGWDVVNEAVADGPAELRDTPALRAIGDDYVLKAFEFAHEADPNVELYYNDYNIEHDYKRERALRLVRRIRGAGLRIDAVGIQGHYGLDKPSIEEIERGIRAYVQEGFKVMITELDVDVLPRIGAGGADVSATEAKGQDPYTNGFPPEMQQRLADRYRALFTLFLRFPELTRVTLWGTTDANTWLNDFPVRGRTNHPMLWDRSYHPKRAFDAVVEVLSTAR
jgi:endo-1,4-beta-xylanase